MKFKLILWLILCLLTWPGRAVGQSSAFDQETLRLLESMVELKNAGRYDEALPLAERLVSMYEKKLGPNHPKVASSLVALATLQTIKGDYALAEPLYQRALAIRERVLGVDHPDVAALLNNIARTYTDEGDYARAEPLLRRALAIYEKAFGPNHMEVATALNNLAWIYTIKGNYTQSEPMHRRALEILERALGPDHPNVVAPLNDLAWLYINKGDFARAEPLFQRALATDEKAFGPNHPEVATILTNLAGLYTTTGDYARAELMHRRALEIFGKAFGPNHPHVATALVNMASLYIDKGDYARAEPLFQRALAIYEKAFGPNHPSVATALNNFASLYEAKGDYARAEPLLRRALAIYEKAFGPNHMEVATALNAVAILYSSKNDYARAEPLFLRALVIYEKALGTNHPSVAAALGNLARIYEDEGDYARAEPLLQRAFAIDEKAFGSNHPAVAAALNNFASLYTDKGDYVRAMQCLQRSIDIDEHNLNLILATGSENQKQSYLNSLSDKTNFAISFHRSFAFANERAAQMALTTILRRKGRALDAMTDQFAALRQHDSAQDKQLLDQLATARSQLATVQLSDKARLSFEERRVEITRLETAVERLEDAVSRRSAEFRSSSQIVTLEAVRAALPADAALVEIAAFRPLNASGNFDQPRYVAYILKRDDASPMFVDLGAADSLDAAANALHSALRDPRRSDVKDLARTLDEQLMRPIRRLLGPTRHILLSPDGALNLIPFAALVDEHGQYLVENYTISYLTSGRDLLRLQVAGRRIGTAPMVLADPVYDLMAASPLSHGTQPTAAVKRPNGNSQQVVSENRRSVDFAALNYPVLPGTAAEALALRNLLPGARFYLQREATEAALKRVHGPRLLHIATHGFFLPDQPAEVSKPRVRGLGLDLESSAPISARRWENPLLRSGLILAGVKQGQSGDGEDGVLTALEAAGLDLWGTKLVVLSACETGLGDVRNGAGVYGLRRALVLAGSETQVMSLWQVSDAATRDLMVAFYQRLQAGDGRAEALRQVQLAMLKGRTLSQPSVARGLAVGEPTVADGHIVSDRTHPYYWAAFIQSGEWANIDGKR